MTGFLIFFACLFVIGLPVCWVFLACDKMRSEMEKDYQKRKLEAAKWLWAERRKPRYQLIISFKDGGVAISNPFPPKVKRVQKISSRAAAEVQAYEMMKKERLVRVRSITYAFETVKSIEVARV